MLKLRTEDGKKVTYKGKKVLIYTALRDYYESEHENEAELNGRYIRFDNTGWQIVDEIPDGIRDRVLQRYDSDLERMRDNDQ